MLSNPEIWMSFFTLFLMELVLGVDNIVFISLLANDLPQRLHHKGRILGVALALLLRIFLLSAISWIMSLQKPFLNPAEWFNIYQGELHEKADLSGRDLILIAGGIFLIYKSVVNIHETIEKVEKKHRKRTASFWPTVLQIGVLDLVLGIDSVITAVGMAKHLGVMIAAICASMIIMLVASAGVGRFVKKHPSVKLLALAFLLLIGVSLLMEGIEQSIPKGYIYFAMCFSIFVEFLILRLVKAKKITVNH
jgi:predicted tellurium resistance membrane protein TerC